MTPELPPSDSAITPPPDLTFAVRYDEFAGQSFPSGNRGHGTLVVREPGTSATYVFTGPSPPSLSLGAELEYAFPAESIHHVEVTDLRISFTGVLNRGTSEPQPFSFHCLTTADTAAIARLLAATSATALSADDNFDNQLARLPSAATPWTSVTGLIVIANVVGFVAMGLAGAGWISVASMAPYQRFGANQAIATTDGQWWRLVASMFLHYGILHLLLNMWALFQAGQLLEKLLGRALYLLVYFGSGICGSLVTLVWHGREGAWSAGASGAVFGIYGALIGYMLRQQHALPPSVWKAGLKGALSFAICNLIFGLVLPGIDNAAHLGGLVGGFALGGIVALPLDLASRRRLTPGRLVLGTAILGVAITLGVLVATRSR